MIEILEYIPNRNPDKSTLKAEVSVRLPKSRQFIEGIKIFQKNESRWISLPSRKIIKNGKEGYYPYMGFDEEIMKAFRDALFQAIDAYLRK